MALLTICGAECGIVTSGLGTAANRHWSSVTGVPTLETSTIRTGSRAIAFAAAATNPSVSRDFPALSSVGYLRAYFRLTDATPTSNIQLAFFDFGATNNGQLTLTTGGVLRVDFSNADAQNGPTLSDNTWYGVEMEADVSANPRVIRWRTFAAGTWTSQTNASNANAADTISSLSVGIVVGPTSGTTVYWDDILIGAATATGTDYSTTQSRGGHVNRYLPTSDGTHSFTAGTFAINAAGADFATNATDIYTYLDDSDQTTITDFVRQKAVSTTEYAEVQFADESTETTHPRAVAVTSTHHAAGTSANQQGVRIHDGTSEATVWTADDVSDTTAHFRHKVQATAPSGGSWSKSLLNATRGRIGFSGDIADVPYWDTLSLEVEFTDSVTAAAGHAAGTGAAGTANKNVQPRPAKGAGAGAAANAVPLINTSTTAIAQHASAAVWVSNYSSSTLDPAAGHVGTTGAAFDTFPQTEAAEATAEAYDLTALISTNSAIASIQATGDAYDATTFVGNNAAGELVEATGEAFDTPVNVAPNAEHAAATGEAYAITATVKASAIAAAATGAAYSAQAQGAIAGILATATGAAYNPAPAVKPNTQHASATGAAYDSRQTTAVAATGTGIARVASVSVQVNAEHAAATAAANANGASPRAEHASATGVAQAASRSVAANPSHVTATGTANDPGKTVKVNAEHAAAAGAATNGISGGSGEARLASGTGAAYIVHATITTAAGHASATASGYDATVKVRVSTTAATGTGQAFNPLVLVAVNAGLVSATGTAYQPARLNIKPAARHAHAVSTAYNAGTDSVVNVGAPVTVIRGARGSATRIMTVDSS